MTVDQQWISAGVAVVAGFLAGAVLAAIARRTFGDSKRRAALRAISSPMATFLFWLAAITGIVTAVGFTSPETLEPIPADVLAWMPRVLVAGLILLAGYAAGGAISAAVGTAAQRAIGHRPGGLEQAIRLGVLSAAVILALGNLGVETTSLQIIIAGFVFSIGLAFALLAGLGGREIAGHVAVGRTLRTEIQVGDHVSGPGFAGKITDLRPTVVILESGSGRTVVAYSSLLAAPFEIRGEIKVDEPTRPD